MPDAAPAARGVKPRRPQASPLFRLVSDHLLRLQTVYDARFAREYGPWRLVVTQVADRFLTCGVLDHGFARIRCDACTHEYLLTFFCKCHYFCPSCHAKQLASWTHWLDTTLFAPVPHRQVVLAGEGGAVEHGRSRSRGGTDGSRDGVASGAVDRRQRQCEPHPTLGAVRGADRQRRTHPNPRARMDDWRSRWLDRIAGGDTIALAHLVQSAKRLGVAGAAGQRGVSSAGERNDRWP